MKYVYYKKQPAYMLLYNRLKNDIIKGLYAYGSRLPSKRTMAAENGISVITVEHTYTLLCDEGYIEPKQRSGYFVIFRVSDGFVASSVPLATASAPASLAADSEIQPASAAAPEFPFSVIAKTMRRVMNDYAGKILEKSPGAGRPELREAIRLYLARSRGIETSTERIIIGSGAEYLYSIIVGILGRGRIYSIENPSYKKIEQVYRAAGAECELLPMCHDGIESRALSEAKGSVLHISPYRSFPTGITATASKKHEYMRWAENQAEFQKKFIIEDDFESEFSILSKPEETLFSLSKQDNVIYMNTFSQTISPSLRAGYMVLPECLVQIFKDRMGFFSCTVPTFEQLVIAELISGGDFERHINRVRRAKRKAQQG